MYRNSSFATKIHAFENDEKLYGPIKNKLKGILRSKHTVPVKLVYGDMFDYVYGVALNRDCPVRGLDFDTCDVFGQEEEALLLAALELFTMNLSIPVFWFRITGTMRNNSLKRKDSMAKVLKLFRDSTNGVLLDWRKLSYRDDSPMQTYQGIFAHIPDVSKVKKGVVLTTSMTPWDNARFSKLLVG
jgi:hypothetical protein